MLSIIAMALNKRKKVLDGVEYALNNIVHVSTGEALSKLLFGVHHGGTIKNEFKNLLLEMDEDKNLEEIRKGAEDNILKNQSYNKKYFDLKGDFVMIKNIYVSVGVNKKLIPKFRGPYVIYKVYQMTIYSQRH
uniref:Uncharacterized protein n=1 Tax=Sipha flava TaxID=143950 RepID=A0A2S2QW31_9HEMI